jgi:hypothetical protein
MERAGFIALQTRSGSGFSGVHTLAARWGQFCAWAKPAGINKMEKITRETLTAYGSELADRVRAGEMAAATAQNYVSAANRVLELARNDRAVSVSPTRDCGIPRRTGIATASKATGLTAHEDRREALSDRAGALLGLQRAFGLRFKESALLDAATALRRAAAHGSITVVDGTKGGRARSVPVSDPAQLAALAAAAAVQGKGRSMVPKDCERYIDFQRACYREFSDWHGERHAYAQARYEALVGAPCPVAAGVRHGSAHHRYLARMLGVTVGEARQLDRAARSQIAEELGHGRISITNAYLG